MELRKVPVCTAISCAVSPCIAEKFKQEARRKDDIWGHRVAEDLQSATIFVYMSSAWTLMIGSLSYQAATALSRSLLGFAALSLAYMTGVGCRELRKCAIEFREGYLNTTRPEWIKQRMNQFNKP